MESIRNRLYYEENTGSAYEKASTMSIITGFFPPESYPPLLCGVLQTGAQVSGSVQDRPRGHRQWHARRRGPRNGAFCLPGTGGHRALPSFCI